MNLIERANALGIEGFMHPAELEKLQELARGRDVLEVGSYRGLSAWAMAQTAKTLYCVDTFRAWTDGQTQNAEEEGLTTYIAFRAAIDRFTNVSWCVGRSEVAASETMMKFDLIFLDAMHTYEDVRDDIARWWPRLRRRGIMAFHDYGHDHFPGVKQAVDERFGDLGPYDENQKTWLVTLRWVRKP